MRYRLALDVGTASCALIGVSLDGRNNPLEPVYDSLDIWQEPLLPDVGVGEPKKAARRRARQARRQIERRGRRLRCIAHLASHLGLDTSAIAPDDGQHIHRLRAQAAEARIGLEDLLRVLLHLAKNRGPSGDWVYADPADKPTKGGKARRGKGADASSDGEAGKSAADKPAAEEKKGIAAGVRKLESLMRAAAADAGKTEITLGQYLLHRREHGETTVLGKKEIGLYPSRRMVEQEFDRIWEKQAEHHSVLRDAAIRKEFFDAVFFQRPLKSPAPMVGRCPLEPTLPRAPAAQPAAQAFRIEKQIADLRWGMGRRAQPLSAEQRGIVRRLLNAHGEVAFSTILGALVEAGHPGPAGHGLNLDRSSRDSLKGNTTRAILRKLELESDWNALDEKTQIQTINFLADLGSPDALDSDDWHRNFESSQQDPATGRLKKREFPSALITFINQLRRHPKFGRLSAMGFDSGRMGYSLKALKQLVTLMEEGLDERAASEQTYPDRFKEKPLSRELPLPEETGNTVVDVALRQVYRAVRSAMEKLGGPPEQVIVELSRDMALGIKKRNEIETKINVNRKARRDAARVISDHGEQPTDKKVERYLLWEQQLHYCPYCNNRIELGEALGSETEREHILPRSLTRVGGKRSQLVLAHRSCNQEKGDRIPWQAFGHDPERWPIVEEHARQLEKNRQWGKARLLLLKDWEEEVLDDEAIKGFTERQFHETSWIAKLAAHWLRNVCPDVSVSRGELTAHLRRVWKLDTVIPEVRYGNTLPVLDREGTTISAEDFQRHRLWWEGHDERAGGVPTDRKPDKRIDHRHHLVDALVISLCDRSLYQKMAQNYKRESERAARGERVRLTRFVDPPLSNIRDAAIRLVTNVVIRHKPDHYPDGRLFDQSAYGLSRKPDEEGKRLLAISKPLMTLIDKKDSAEKTQRTLERIESAATRALVVEAFEQRLAAGTNIKEVFNTPILHPQYNMPIRRVRLLSNSADTAATVIHVNRQGQRLEKRYPHAGNAYLEVRVEGGEITGGPRLVTMQQAMREKGSKPPPGVRRFWKGDVVRLEDGSLHLVGILAAEGGGQLRLVPVTETCTFGELKKRGLTMRTVSGRKLAGVIISDV